MTGRLDIDPLLRVVGLGKRFGGVQAVGDASFDAARGQITGLIGPNGAGKSTVLAMVAGALVPTSGRIFYDGVDVTGSVPHRMARRGVVRTFQSGGEFGRLTVLDNMLVAPLNQRGDSLWRVFAGPRTWRRQECELADRAQALLDRFGLNHKINDYAAELSGGQRRLLELARALMAEPELLLLDEPMAGVNPSLVGELASHLEHLRDEGLTMVLVEHELDLIERTCDRIVVLAQGGVIGAGSMTDLRSNEAVLEAYIDG